MAKNTEILKDGQDKGLINPFIKIAPVRFIKKIESDYLVRLYRAQLDVDVSSIMSMTDSVYMYECTASGYRFFSPLSLSGDATFYERLQKIDWYYMPRKWEHDYSIKYVKPGDNILEVGCGEAYFLRKIISKYPDANCVGLELNENAVFSDANLKVLNETAESFCAKSSSSFDHVFLFHVLEHIPQVAELLGKVISSLKPGGKLIICVPNNDSFIKHDKESSLNLPPHHMGLWNEKSLRSIEKYFNIDLTEVICEPLQEYHYEYYFMILLRRYFGKRGEGILMKLLCIRPIHKLVHLCLKRRSERIKGLSVLSVYTKRS